MRNLGSSKGGPELKSHSHQQTMESGMVGTALRFPSVSRRSPGAGFSFCFLSPGQPSGLALTGKTSAGLPCWLPWTASFGDKMTRSLQCVSRAQSESRSLILQRLQPSLQGYKKVTLPWSPSSGPQNSLPTALPSPQLPFSSRVLIFPFKNMLYISGHKTSLSYGDICI